MPGRKVGSLDLQFSKDWDSVKANQLVQSLQQVIATVNLFATSSSTPAATGVAKHVLATQAALGADHTVAGLEAGQVLVATAAAAAHFAFLKFGEMAGVDSGTFEAPANGDVISFINGYWSAVSSSGILGLADPGSDAIVMWDTSANAGAGGLVWSFAGLGIKITAGRLAVDATQLTHGQLLGLLADDHPQYALVSDVPLLDGLNVFSLLNKFLQGLIVAGGDITLSGDFEQSGEEPEQRITNTDDSPDEGAWRMHVEPGQQMWAACNDDGSDAEDWLYVQRIEDVVDTIGLEANYLTFNGADVVTAEPGPTGTPYLTVNVAGVTYYLTLYRPT